MKWFLYGVMILVLVGCAGQAAVPTPAPQAPATPTALAVVEPTVLATVEVQATPDASIMPVTVRQFVIDATQSSAQYAVNEVFLREDRPYRAVGTTNVVSGTFVVATEGVPAGKVSKIQIDLRTLQSDSGRRDNAIRERWLESNTYPYAEFVSTNALNLPESYQPGSQVSFNLVGDMTVHGVTKSVEWLVDGTLTGDTVQGQATTTINMSDFGITAPNIANMIKVEDQVELMVQFVAWFGALGFNQVARRIGAKKAILGSLVIWTSLTVVSYFIVKGSVVQFLLLGAGIAVVLGGTQALSRSLFSQMIPKGKESEYYSLYEVSERGTSWIGPLVFGLVYQFTNSYRLALSMIGVFFVVGFLLLIFVNVRRAINEAGNEAPVVV
jgi:polyisoprenoid-binding protein YceI